MKKVIYILTGGTINYIAPHFAICSPAYGTIGKQIFDKLYVDSKNHKVFLINTRMASNNTFDTDCELHRLGYFSSTLNPRKIETNDDLSELVDLMVQDDQTRCIILAAAVCDFEPDGMRYLMDNDKEEELSVFGKNGKRLHKIKALELSLRPSYKIISKIRKERKDIFLVSFKATSGLEKSETYAQALANLKNTSSNLVFANDILNKHNMIVTPEEYPYYAKNRDEAVEALCEITLARLNLTFKRTEVIEGSRANPEDGEWKNKIPKNFVPVLKELIKNKAYKSFNGKTTGHFGCIVSSDNRVKRLSSVRKENHNEVFENGMAKILEMKNDRIVAEGAKPSVGEHTQDMIFEQLSDKIHSIVHFHSPLKPDAKRIPVAEQKPFECGSNECGLNTEVHEERD